MKYCVKSRQPKSLLQKVDEIRVEYKDREQLRDLVQEFPEKTYLLTVPSEEEIDFHFVQEIAEKVNLILELYRLDKIVLTQCNEAKIKWYWAFPITSFYELKSIALWGPSYVLLGAPLYFSLSAVRKFNIPIRLVANQAQLSYLPTFDGHCGPWIRPEGIPAYEKYVDTIEFATTGLEQEATYYKIYAEDKKWLNNLDLLIHGLNCGVSNITLPPDLDEFRTNCGQKCMESDICSFCTTGIKFSHTLEDFIRKHAKK
jgi:hypothetical protein